MEEESKSLPPKDNFSEWYNELLMMAQVMDVRYPIKGIYVWYPFGFSIRKKVYNMLRALMDVDHQECYFPMLIPKPELLKESEHIKGFEDEVYWVTHGGLSPLEIPLALRPTSETAIYPMYKLWIRSHADLPLKLYQIVNTFRYETKQTRPLIRLREITSFKEAHTAHATWEDAEKQVHEAMDLYSDFFTKLSVPFVINKRPDWDKFPGADYTMAFDTLMPNGRSLQIGTVHHLGTKFAKTYDITYEDDKGERQYVNQTCYGISERCIAAVIGIHGDNKGLVLPPNAAPTQVVIIPIVFKSGGEEVLDVCRKVKAILNDSGITAVLDDTNERPGAKYYKWEMKGVPFRIEIGPRDIKNNAVMLVRRDGVKQSIPMDGLSQTVQNKLMDFQAELLKKASDFMWSRIKDCATLDEAKAQIESGWARMSWCGEKACGLEMENVTGGKLLGEPKGMTGSGTCPVCGKPSDKVVLVAKSY
ncbi:prolyl-tRNA synthetase [Methanocella paludicola SANAE]|uniref:Proline--tRNA ligase n=1 Tax=Methanocella paludicola (strain DSM 17711 / JCM 13418 / NBRC 101707 / SANAE) TaxID=304371 RepID=D1YZQ3_METPS|nr:proline--tRNA ligase [Methanocella paludicola]BAI61925.1 prolyl-tRNA synthetase [Methanocella paludicola SANAE]